MVMPRVPGEPDYSPAFAKAHYKSPPGPLEAEIEAAGYLMGRPAWCGEHPGGQVYPLYGPDSWVIPVHLSECTERRESAAWDHLEWLTSPDRPMGGK